jgi:hypothetical protein
MNRAMQAAGVITLRRLSPRAWRNACRAGHVYERTRMKLAPLVAAATMFAALGVPPATAADAEEAAAKKRVLLDLSSESLIDAASAKAVVAAAIPPKLWKLYPARKWGFVSQVEGGFTQAKICVVTARVMLAPLTLTNGVIMRPTSRATAFDAIPNATLEQCRAMARDKLREATEAVVSGLVKV